MEELRSFVARLEKIPEEADVNAAFGKPETVGDYTLIPVAELSYGFGMGVGFSSGDAGSSEAATTGEAEGMGGGAGGGAGVRARPLAYIKISPAGVYVEPIVDQQKIALAGILLTAWIVGWLGVALRALFRPRS